MAEKQTSLKGVDRSKSGYQVVFGMNEGELARKVEALQAEGWKPQGGVTFSRDYGMFQAMVKE